MKRTERDRRDWSLLIFVVPFGILLMLLAGQLAMRIVPWWILSANMGSALSLDGQPGPIPLFNMQILTPFVWQDTYLTPSVGDGFVFPPFIVIEPSVVVGTQPTDAPGTTSTPQAPIPTTTLQQSTATLPPPLRTVTNNPTNSVATETKVAGATATNTLPRTTTVTPTGTPTVTQTGTSTATTTGTATSTVTPTKTPTLVPTGYPSTMDPGLTGPLPIDITGPDGSGGGIPQGSYAVVDLGISNPVMIYGPLDTIFYEIVYYEIENGSSGNIQLDNVILGISNDPLGLTFYKVFDWGDGITDFNTNVSSWPEVDNQVIPMAGLYNGTGILIDADNATSEPPSIFGGYRYLVIISPVKPSADTIDVDAIEIWP